jgi:hypothetical protein
MDKKNVLIIIILIFLFIYWFQESEKYNKNRNKNKKVYKVIDNIKLPLLVSSFVYLAFCIKGDEINLSGGADISSESNDYLEIFTNQPEF